MSKIPENLKYSKSHEWVRMNGNKATVGITDHAQHELTDIVFVELPPVGKTATAGQVVTVVESVKVAADIYSPVNGKVTAINKKLEATPGLINTDPYGEGWIFEIETSDQCESLMDAENYRRTIEA